jgi:hypothetical protein
MEAYRLRERVKNGRLHITGLDGLRDEEVEVIILVETPEESRLPGEATQPAARKPGSAKGQIQVADDFQAPLDEDTLRDFYE